MLYCVSQLCTVMYSLWSVLTG